MNPRIPPSRKTDFTLSSEMPVEPGGPARGSAGANCEKRAMSLSNAARLHIRIDKRRRNAHPMNVATLENAKNGG